MQNFVCNFNPTLLAIGGFEIRWYGLFYLFGFLFALFLMPILAKKRNLKISRQKLLDLIFWIFVGGVVGGRIGYFLFYAPHFFISNPLEILQVWHGGMSFHGGILGGALVVYFLAPKYKITRMNLADILIIPVVFGLGMGRIANFINCELPGRPTQLPWAMIFPNMDNLTRHPSQIYALLEFAIIFIFLLTLFWTYKKIKPGIILFLGLFLMGLARFLNEFVREPDYYFYGLTAGQIWSIPLILVGIGGIVVLKMKKN